MTEESKEMSSRVFTLASYDEALLIIGEYVNITSAEDLSEEFDLRKRSENDVTNGTANIMHTKAFTVSIADVPNMEVADFFGIATENKMSDKFERTGYHAVKSEFVNAPIITEFPVTLECELAEVVNPENLHAVVGKIVNVSAEESVAGDKDKICLEKVNALVFDQHCSGYFSIGEKVGQAWNAGAELMNK